MTKLEPISSIHPASYNPRITDLARLDLVKLSIRKLGFLLPVYATEAGLIVSGHQRQIAAKELGCTEIPVRRIPVLTQDRERAVNLIFNRCTNDMRRTRDGSPAELFKAIPKEVLEAARALPDLQGAAMFPCLTPELVDPKTLAGAEGLHEADYQRNAARAAGHHKIVIPIVVGPAGEILNGLGRLRYALERGRETIEIVRVSQAQTEPARYLLNNLSMDFDVKSHFADVLRYHSRRKKQQGFKKTLGLCYTFAITKSKPAYSIDLSKASCRAQWIEHYGKTVLDFGAGNREEIQMVRDIGVKGVCFEPYACPRGKNDPDLDLSRQIATEFLAEIEAGTEFHSVFCSAIFNSIPFKEDRLAVAAILGATAGPYTTLYSHSISATHARAAVMDGRNFSDHSMSNLNNFPLDYEPNVGMTISDRFKVQKYHTVDEYREIMASAFEIVMLGEKAGHVTAICRKPKPLDIPRLNAALEFEFNLPYSEGRRLDMVQRAKEAFGRRLNCNLFQPN